MSLENLLNLDSYIIHVLKKSNSEGVDSCASKKLSLIAIKATVPTNETIVRFLDCQPWQHN